MTEIEILKRQIELKKQRIILLVEEIAELEVKILKLRCGDGKQIFEGGA